MSDLYISMNVFLYNINQLQILIDELYNNGEYNQKQKSESICSLMRHRVYQGPQWNTAAGLINAKFCDYVKSKNVMLFNTMSDPELVITDSLGAQFEGPHWAATIDGYLSTSVIKDEWNGWAGDLAKLTKEIQTDTGNATDYNYLIQVTKEYLFSSAHEFSKRDLVSDIDAENISNRINNNQTSKFSTVVSNYYNSGSSKRYTEFVNRRDVIPNPDGYPYFMSNILDIMRNQALYTAVNASGDYISTSPVYDQIYAISGTFVSQLLQYRAQGL